MMSKPSKHQISEHIWRLGRWIFGAIVIIVWFKVNTLPAVLTAFAALGLYEQLHGVICKGLDKLLKCSKDEEHDEWE